MISEKAKIYYKYKKESEKVFGKIYADEITDYIEELEKLIPDCSKCKWKNGNGQ